MAKGANGPRQPLSQRRPGRAASTKGKSGVNVPGTRVGALPPTAPKSRRTVKTTGVKPSQKAPLVSKSPRRRADRVAVAHAVLERLAREYPDARCELDHRNAFELLCATILSAQCTDARVNMVTPVLFARFPDAEALSNAEPSEVEAIVKTTGFFRAKTKSLVAMARSLVDRHAGQVPRDLDSLVKLAGVGRKTANVILGNAFGVNEGIVVDTHVQRLSRRLGLTREAEAVPIERELMPLFPRDSWSLLSHLLIWHGRRVCDARKPRCSACVLADVCPSALASAPGAVG
jgi:endonuclease-3